MKPVLNSITLGGSGSGISYWSSVMTCARKAHLNKGLEQDRPQRVTLDAAFTGTLFHALMEMYYKHQTDDFAIELDGTGASQEMEEALRLFREYAKRFRPDEWITLGTEVLYPREGVQADVAAIKQMLGIEPLTIRIDMLVEVLPEHVDGLVESRGLDLKPGVYLVDHKTSERRGNDQVFRYQNNLQMDVYMAVWNACNPEQQCQGMLVNNVYRYKALNAKAFETILVAPPSEDRVQQLKEWLMAAEGKVRNGDITPNLSACFNTYGACPHLISGACNRRAHV
jgi:hypothetical protein